MPVILVLALGPFKRRFMLNRPVIGFSGAAEPNEGPVGTQGAIGTEVPPKRPRKLGETRLETPPNRYAATGQCHFPRDQVNRPYPKLAFGSMVIVENEERLRRPAPRDGMLDCGDEQIDKRVCRAPD